MVITLYIHGTILPPVWCRELPFFHHFYFCPPGLTLAKDLGEPFQIRKITAALSESDPTQFPWDHFYVFGWSGDLLSKAREKAAADLFVQLKALFSTFPEPPSLQIISHSHGGNVALWLGKMFSDQLPELNISQFIALACPVQTTTADYLSLPVFERVYSIHSHLDLLQVIDPQGLHAFWDVDEQANILTLLNSLKNQRTLFSKRHFPSSDRLLQVHFTYHSLELLHISFLSPRFFRILPEILERLKSQKQTSDEIHLNWK